MGTMICMPIITKATNEIVVSFVGPAKVEATTKWISLNVMNFGNCNEL